MAVPKFAEPARLVVNNDSTSRIGVHLIQQGALAGIEASF